MMNILKKFLYQLEPLEFDLESQFREKKIGIFKRVFILSRKTLLLLYKNYQRIILKPSIRKFFANLEKGIFFSLRNFNQNSMESFNLKKDGLIEIDSIFSSNELDFTVKELSADLDLNPIYTSHGKFKLNKIPEGVHTGYIDTNILVKTKYILKAAHNPKLLKILDGYFKCKYKLDWIWSWWSFPTEKAIGPQNFHRDYESMNFIKVFTYLTDVEDNGGPHEFVIGSHLTNKYYKRERFKDEDIAASFGDKNIKKIIGKKGKTFLANTYGIHKGHHPIKSNRLVLVFLYSVVPSNRSPKLPVVNSSEVKISKNYINNLFIR